MSAGSRGFAAETSWCLRSLIWSGALVVATPGCLAIGYGESHEIASQVAGGPDTAADTRRPTTDTGPDGAGTDASAAVAQPVASDLTEGGTGNAPPLADSSIGGDAGVACEAPHECEDDVRPCPDTSDASRAPCPKRCEIDADCAAMEGFETSCTQGLCLVDCTGEKGRGEGPCPDDTQCRELRAEGVFGAMSQGMAEASCAAGKSCQDDAPTPGVGTFRCVHID